MEDSLIVGLLVAALGLVFIRFGWSQSTPALGQPVTTQHGIGFLLMFALFMAGIWLMLVGIRMA